MIAEQEVQLMKAAYGILYEVENCLRTYIKYNMEDCYDIHWFYYAPRIVLKRPPSKSFENLLFSDYETYFRNYPKAFKNLPSKFYTQLRQIYPLRNKISHHHLLSLSEFELLERNSTFLINFMENNLNKSLITSYM
ncbi:hypothetical protein [Gracilibacillus salinarum]|uniref:Swt1-like HEPN domain-containing protein n=1 Tax=Gracilibacillus salinarum TaxID=2932255 RepID=A0ABY4GKB1_9BACI|nr:hypothetical protein [Gracilibacillus salinarum]UOQ84633.1 hypothetical protein MUN87_18535 [Gracilibacillus salinarum]